MIVVHISSKTLRASRNIFPKNFRCCTMDRGNNENGNPAEKEYSAGDINRLNEVWLKDVNTDQLNSREISIHKCHLEALKNNEKMYTDPETGYKVMTRLSHLLRGKCCGNACRHCPFEQENVSRTSMNSKKYNSAFWE